MAVLARGGAGTAPCAFSSQSYTVRQLGGVLAVPRFLYDVTVMLN